MNVDLVKIEFYFPKSVDDIKSKEQLADFALNAMKKKKSTKCAGFSDEKLLRRNILGHIGDANINTYSPLSKSQEQEVRDCIKKTVSRCDNYLSIPTKNYVFVFPYLPSEEETVFRGVMGFASYSCVFHIFLSPISWSPESLADTVAHELNHTIFYYHHYDNFNNYTLLDEMILEGLAENFRGHVLVKTPAPWSIALSREKALKLLDSMSEKTLFSKDKNLIKDVLFGNKTYDRWTGYSIGYWLVKELLRKNPKMSWEAIMKLPTQKILDFATKEKEGQ